MKTSARFALAAVFAVLLALSVTGCNYDVPLTAQPTRPIDPRLIGNWTSADGKEKLRIRPYDPRTFVLSYDGDLFRAWHSDLDGSPFVSVQCLDAENHTWLYVTYQLDDNGRKLSLRNVRDTVITKESVKTSEDAQALLRKNLKNPGLFGTGDDTVGVYTKE
jgi:hypothetical protein